MLEMLVVIGIIGILMGVVLTQFGGSTESAKAAKCATNMHNLVMAAHACALEQQDGYFPAATSFSYSYADHKELKLKYNHRIGWIAGAETRRNGSDNPVGFQPIAFNADKDSILRALKNGALWKAMGSNRTAYQCPIHAEAARKANGTPAGWSYAMNKEFGYDNPNTDDKKWWGQTKNSISIGGKARSPDKVLMFAELQGANIKMRGYDTIDAVPLLKGGAPYADGRLDYESESIGFNHQASTKGYSANIAFADGHVDKLLYPRSGSGISVMKLTEALCRGHEVSFSKGGYTDLQPE